MRALNPLQPFWYTPQADLDEQGHAVEGATRFRLRGLNGAEVGYVAPEFIMGEGGVLRGLSGKGVELTLRYGLRDWENFSNDDGPVPFNPANFGLIEYAARAEIAMQIIAASYATKEEKKT